MSKGKACIVVGCITTCSVFCLMCYLMSNVNPPPIPASQLEAAKGAFDNMMFDIPPVSVGYGLEKTDIRTMEYPTYSTQSYPSDNYNAIWQYTPPKLKNIWPTSTDSRDKPIRTIPTPVLKVLNKTEDVDRETTINYADINNTFFSLLPRKRSVKDLRNHGSDMNSIILKIVANESNRIIIQIKIGSDDEQEENISEDKNPKRKAKFSLSLKTNNIDELERTELAKNTVISILQNDSVVVNEYDDRISSYNKVENYNTTVQENKNITAVTPLASQNNSTTNYENNSTIENVTKTSISSKNNIILTTSELRNYTNQNNTVRKHDLKANLMKLVQNVTSVTPTDKVIMSIPSHHDRMKSMKISEPRITTLEKLTETTEVTEKEVTKNKINSNIP